jgi:hypothetical protein
MPIVEGQPMPFVTAARHIESVSNMRAIGVVDRIENGGPYAISLWDWLVWSPCVSPDE